MGLEPVPKLNFAAGHDIWLGEYSRMVTTKKYYEVCGHLIEEVAHIFDKPRFFHLGMDEENAEDQRYLDLVVIRQNDLWWHDFNFLCMRWRRTAAVHGSGLTTCGIIRMISLKNA